MAHGEVEPRGAHVEAEGIWPIHAAADRIGCLASGKSCDGRLHHDQRQAPGRDVLCSASQNKYDGGADVCSQAVTGEDITVGRRVHSVRHGQGKTAWSKRLETEVRGITGLMTKESAQPWSLQHSPQKIEQAVRGHVIFTLLLFALATAYRLLGEREATGGEPVGCQCWRRQLLE
jgi:hypothetical protein